MTTPMAPSTQTVTLTDDALFGVGPRVRALASLPQTVRLGRIHPAALAPVPELYRYFDPSKMTAPPPASTNRRARAADSMAQMYLNDRYGCCVISGKAHALGLWSANDSDSGGVIIASDKEIEQQYFGICGPGDNGCVITQVLDVMRTRGFMAGGRVHKIDGYCRVDNRNKPLTQAAIYLFGATTIGIDLPNAWTNQSVWDVTSSRTVGGHDVTPVDYDEKGVYVSSWGRIYLMTWAAYQSRQWVKEVYVMLAPAWYGNDQLAPGGIRVEKLKADLAKFQQGGVPDIDPPNPGPGPGPTPPTPGPSGEVVVTLVGLDAQGREVRRWRPA